MARNLKHSVQLNFWQIRVKQNKKRQQKKLRKYFLTWKFKWDIFGWFSNCVHSRKNRGVSQYCCTKRRRTFFKVTVFRDLCSMTLQNSDFYPWFYAVFSFQKVFTTFWGSSRAQSALLLATQHTKKWHHDFPNQLNSYLYSTIAKVNHKTICFLPKCFKSELHFLKTFLKVPTLVNGVALGKAMNTEKGGTFLYSKRVDLNLQWDEEGHRQVLILQFSFTYSETISHWSFGCRDSHVRGVGGQPDVSDLGCEARSCYHVV